MSKGKRQCCGLRTRALCGVVACSIVSSACLASALRGAGGALVARGGAAAGVRGGSLGAARAGALSGTRGALAATRAGSIPRTPLRGILEEAASSSGRGFLRVDPAGALYRGGRYVGRVTNRGTIETGSLLREPVGRIHNGHLWELDAFGTLSRPVGQVTGWVGSRGAPLRTAPNQGLLRHLSGRTYLEVIEAVDGWYQVRLVDGTTDWMAAPFLALTGVLAIGDDDDESGLSVDEKGLFQIVLASGATLWSSNFVNDDGIVSLTLPDGETVLLDEAAILAARWKTGATILDLTEDRTEVLLASGQSIFVDNARVDGDAIVLKSGEQETVVDPSLVLSAKLPAPTRR